MRNELYHNRLIFVDLEYLSGEVFFNGESSNIHEIIEIGVFHMRKKGAFRYEKIIKPKLVKKYCKNVKICSKINIDDVYLGVDIEEVLLELHNIVKEFKAKIVCYGNSDIFNILNTSKIYNIDHNLTKNDFIDLSVEFKKFYKLNNTISLSKALKKVNPKGRYSRHRALDDAESLMVLFHFMLSDGFEISSLFI